MGERDVDVLEEEHSFLRVTEQMAKAWLWLPSEAQG